MRLDLGRLLRGPHGQAVRDLAPLLSSGLRIEDPKGKVLLELGAAGEARFPITVGELVVGTVIGGDEAARFATLVAHLYAREEEKLALAQETLGRYKELTVLYDMSAELSRVLDVDEVTARIVGDTHRSLRASHTVLFRLDARAGALEPLATLGGDASRLVLSDVAGGIEERVVRTGQAEFVEHAEGGGSVIAAPLRSGDGILGLVRVTSTQAARWTAGDLKLVASLASLAGSALSHALLHRDRLRQLALRGQIERFVAPTLFDLALDGRAGHAGDALAVLACDLGEAAQTLDASRSPAEVTAVIHHAIAVALDVLLGRGATVAAPEGDTLLAFFGDGTDFGEAAAAASEAARALLGAVEKAVGARPGIGLARVEPSTEDDGRRFHEGVSAAALLQAASDGRVLSDAAVAGVLPRSAHTRIGPITGPRGLLEAHEVRA